MITVKRELLFQVQFNLAQYHSFADVINYLNALAITYPERVSVQPIGTTHEGRQIPLIKVGSRHPKYTFNLVRGEAKEAH